jgi:hypothetical protein
MWLLCNHTLGVDVQRAVKPRLPGERTMPHTIEIIDECVENSIDVADARRRRISHPVGK